MSWTVERDEQRQLVVPLYGIVNWHDHEADTYARQFLILHRPFGLPYRLTIKPPFYADNDRAQCMGCRPGTPYSACETALWAKAWQKKRPQRNEADAYRWGS